MNICLKYSGHTYTKIIFILFLKFKFIWVHFFNLMTVLKRQGVKKDGAMEGAKQRCGVSWIQASAWVFGQCWFYRRYELHYEVGPTLGLTFSTSIAQWVAAGCVDRGGIRGKLTSWMGNSHFNKGNSPEKVVALIG